MSQLPPPPPPSEPPPLPPGQPGHRSGGFGGPESRWPAGPPAKRSSRSLLRMLGVLAALAIAFVAFFALRGGSSGLNPVAEAAERTARQPGAHLALEVTYRLEGSSSPIVGTGSGAYNARSGRTQVNLTVPIPGHAPVVMESVGNDRLVLLRSPMFAAELPPGTEWLGMEPLLGRSSETAFGTTGGAGSTLETLKAVGGVERLDQQKVRGHMTTRYKGQIDPSQAARFLGENGEAALAHEYEVIAEREPEPIEVEAWVDGRGLTRQVRMVQQLPTAGGPPLTMDMRMQFFQFGAHPKIKLPPKRRVLDYTPVLRAELGMIDGSTLGPLRPPAAATPLPAAAFRHRASGICRRVDGEAKDLAKRDAGLIGAMKGLDPEDVRAGGGKSVIDIYERRLTEPVIGLARRLLRKMASLDPPAAWAGDYRRLLKVGAMETEWGLAKTRALQLGVLKLPAFEAHKAQLEKEGKAAERIAAKLGVSACDHKENGGEGGGAQTEGA